MPQRFSTENLSAYVDYLKGEHLLRQRGWSVKKSIPFFESAVASDPNYAAAHASLAAAYAMTSGHIEKSIPAVETALRIDPSLAEAHAVRGFYAVYHEWDWNTAEASFDRAIELDPNSVTAFHWRGEYRKLRGRFAEAESDLLRALELDPLSLTVLADISELHFFAGDDQKSIGYARQALEIDPDHQYANHAISRSLYRMGHIDDAFEHRLKYLAAEKNLTAPEEKAEYRQRMKEIFRSGGPDAIASYGFKNQERQLLNSKDLHERITASVNLARFEAAQGKRAVAASRLSEAFSELQRSGQPKGFLFRNIAVNPSFSALRPDPKFQLILRNMGLSETPSS